MKWLNKIFCKCEEKIEEKDYLKNINKIPYKKELLEVARLEIIRNLLGADLAVFNAVLKIKRPDMCFFKQKEIIEDITAYLKKHERN